MADGNNGTVNPNTDQTEFDSMGGMPALSKGYDNHEVLDALQENAGTHIHWETMSDSLAEYYSDIFYMEDRTIERLTDLDEFWTPYVKDTAFYPVDCVFTGMEMETIDWHKTDFEQAVKEQEGLWLRNGGPTDQEWDEYKTYLSKKCGMDDLLQVYQDAYGRYRAAE